MADGEPTRRRLLALTGGALATGLAGCQEVPGDEGTPTVTTETSPTATPEEPLPEAIDLETLASDLQSPLDLAFVPEEDLRYVATKAGQVLVHDGDGLRGEPLVDKRGEIERGYENGLLGIALHPEFAENRRLFVRYSAPSREGTPEDYSHTFVLSEFEVGEDGTRVEPDSERSVLEIPQPHANHNSGAIVFGPDGYLYVGAGDGGDAGDTGLGHPDDWYDGNEGGNGQDTSEHLLGGILRIDVDDEDGDRAYGIPDDNPLVGEEGHREEYYAWGFRNPWGASFDEDRFFVADVGQERMEEVNLVERGGNYGWNVKEGSTCFDASDRFAVPDGCPDETPADVRGGEPLIDPIVEYPHREPDDGGLNGAAVVGGAVYRGSAIPALEGRYVFGDLQPSGRLFVGTETGDGWSAGTVALVEDAAERLENVNGFARDDDGELYVLGGGGVHRIVPAA